MSVILLAILLALLYIGWVLSAPAREEQRKKRELKQDRAAYLNDLVTKANVLRERYFATITADQRAWLQKQRDLSDPLNHLGDQSLRADWYALLSIAIREGTDPTILVPGTRANNAFINKIRAWRHEAGRSAVELPALSADELLVALRGAKSPLHSALFIGLLALAGLAVIYYADQTKSAKEQDEAARVSVDIAYDLSVCPADFPLRVEVINRSNGTLNKVQWRYTALAPGRSTNPIKYQGLDEDSSDRILQPNTMITLCYKEPELSDKIGPATLQWKADTSDVEFASN